MSKNLTFATKKMVIAGLLIGLAVVIPMISFKIYIPPFSATFASHLPVMLAMFIDPATAAAVAAGSTLGFLLTGMDMVVVARAAMHIIFAVVGALMIKKGYNIFFVFIITMLLHGLGEALVVVPFGWPLYVPGNPLWKQAGIFVGLGTMIHHTIDGALTLVVYSALYKAKLFHKPLVFKKTNSVQANTPTK